uniref:Uncharacterized protein n=1 Tax=viral metagenome TaxID=1070528 RepID=A0A6M3ISJ1_9ZZZZ
MDDQKRDQINKLKRALLEFLGTNGRHYGDLTRMEQSIEDLAQALNTRLDQMLIAMDCGCTDAQIEQSPNQKLADIFMSAGSQLARGGRVDQETVDAFSGAIDMLDVASDFRRKAASIQDKAESAIIKDKRNKGS